MRFGGGRIDALVLCAGHVLRTSAPDEVTFGVAQVRRLLVSPTLRVLHVVFAPDAPRPLLLGLVRLENRGATAERVDYSEVWDVGSGPWRAASGACERLGEGSTFALADAGLGVRAVAPEPPPRTGLGLDVRLGLPPGARRELYFAYVDAPTDDDPRKLVRAWRGDVAAELVRCVESWRSRAGPSVADYLAAAATLPV